MRTGTVGVWGRTLLIVLGLCSITYTLYEAKYNEQMFTEWLLRNYTPLTIYDAVLSSPDYVFERWLVIAVVITVVLNAVLYPSNFISACYLFHAEGKVVGSRLTVAPFLLLILSVVSMYYGVYKPIVLLQQFYVTPGSMDALKTATLTLLALFVVYDLAMMIIGHLLRSPEAASTRQEAIIAFIRIDAPILAAYLILFCFTSYWINLSTIDGRFVDWIAKNGMTAATVGSLTKFNLDAFGAGAAALKLVLSNILFTVMLIEAMITGSALQTASGTSSLAAGAQDSAPLPEQPQK